MAFSRDFLDQLQAAVLAWQGRPKRDEIKFLCRRTKTTMLRRVGTPINMSGTALSVVVAAAHSTWPSAWA